MTIPADIAKLLGSAHDDACQIIALIEGARLLAEKAGATENDAGNALFAVLTVLEEKTDALSDKLVEPLALPAA